MSVIPGCKGGSDLAKPMVFPDYGHFPNTDLISFLFKFMCWETKQRNSQISKNQYTRGCSFPGSLMRLGRKMRKSAKQKLLSSKECTSNLYSDSPSSNLLSSFAFRMERFLIEPGTAQVVVVKNSPTTCRWCRTCTHHGEGCALVSWDENWYVWWEYPFGAKDDETPASGWSGSIVYTVCLECCTQIPEEGYDTEQVQAGTQKDQRRVSLNQKISIQTLAVSYSAICIFTTFFLNKKILR